MRNLEDIENKLEGIHNLTKVFANARPSEQKIDTRNTKLAAEKKVETNPHIATNPTFDFDSSMEEDILETTFIQLYGPQKKPT